MCAELSGACEVTVLSGEGRDEVGVGVGNDWRAADSGDDSEPAALIITTLRRHLCKQKADREYSVCIHGGRSRPGGNEKGARPTQVGTQADRASNDDKCISGIHLLKHNERGVYSLYSRPWDGLWPMRTSRDLSCTRAEVYSASRTSFRLRSPSTMQGTPE